MVRGYSVNPVLGLLICMVVENAVSPLMAREEIVCRSLAEVRQRQSNGESIDISIDAEFSLAFASERYETVYVQESDDAIQVFTDRMTAEALSKLGVASRIRIRGIFSFEKQSIVLSSYDVISDERLAIFDGFGEFGTGQKLAINGLANVPLNVMETFVSPHGVSLFGFRSAIPIEVHLSEFMPREDVLPLVFEEIKVCGALLVNERKDAGAYFVTHAMQRSQFPPPTTDQKLLDHYRSGAYQKKYFDEWKGQVLFTDKRSFLLLGLKDRVIRVSTRFCGLVSAGDLISVLEWRPEKPAKERVFIESRLMEQFAVAPLPAVTKYGIDKLDKLNPATNRLEVEGRIVSISTDNRICRMDLSTTFGTVEIQTVLTNDSVPFTEGDVVRTAGTPWDSKPEGSKNNSWTIFVPLVSDIHLTHRQIKVPDNVVWGIGIGSFLILGLAVGWTQSLRSQVAKRTEKLNQLNSQLTKSFEAIRFAILLEDSKGKVASLNSKFSELVTSQVAVGNVVNRALSDVEKIVNDETAFRTFTNEVRESNGESYQRNFLLKEDRGVSKAIGTPVIDSNGKRYGYLWIFEDITDSVRYQEQLLQSQKMQAVGQLSSGFAHDFNNILTIIRSSLAMIRIQSQKKVSIEEYVESADDAVSRAALITTHLLDYCRLSHLNLRTVDLNNCVANAHLLLRRSVDLQISIELELSEEPLYVTVDESRLEQVFLNLGINARDSFDGRKGRICFSTSSHFQNGKRFAVFSIEDNGCGMTPEVKQRAFEPFFTTKGPGKGTGLGLSMAQGIVDQLNGFIACDSDPSRGTTIRIYLPNSNRIESPSTQELETIALDSEDSLSLRILFVDDEISILANSSALLKSIGSEVIEASSGKKAMELLEEDQDFDVVILDLNMPDVRGEEVLKFIEQRWPWMRVIISSGYTAHLQNSIQADTLSRLQFLPKPYKLPELYEALSSIESFLRQSS
jgi:signal transduction histidine kinase/CheY-like chemotaxis protein